MKVPVTLIYTFRHISLTLVLGMTLATAFGQRLEYEIKFGAINLGECFVERHEFNDTSIYILNSKVKLCYLIATQHVNYSSYSVYVNNKLVSAEVKAIVNGKEDSYTRTLRKGGGYDIFQREGDESKNYHLKMKDIELSSSKLFFTPPTEMDSSYAELYGNFGSIVIPDSNQTVVTNNGNKRRTHYYYEGNHPVKRKIEYPVVDFVMDLLMIKPVITNRSSVDRLYAKLFGQ